MNWRRYVHDEPILVVRLASDVGRDDIDEGDGEQGGVEHKPIAINLPHPMRVGIFHCRFAQLGREFWKGRLTILISFNTHQSDNHFRNISYHAE